MRILMIGTAALLAASPVLAQQSGLVNIDLSNLDVANKAEIAKDINLNE